MMIGTDHRFERDRVYMSDIKRFVAESYSWLNVVIFSSWTCRCWRPADGKQEHLP